MFTLVTMSNFDLLTMTYNEDYNERVTEYARVEVETREEAIELAYDMHEWFKANILEISGFAFNPTELYIDTDKGTYEYDDGTTQFYLWIWD